MSLPRSKPPASLLRLTWFHCIDLIAELHFFALASFAPFASCRNSCETCAEQQQGGRLGDRGAGRRRVDARVVHAHVEKELVIYLREAELEGAARADERRNVEREVDIGVRPVPGVAAKNEIGEDASAGVERRGCGAKMSTRMCWLGFKLWWRPQGLTMIWPAALFVNRLNDRITCDCAPETTNVCNRVSARPPSCPSRRRSCRKQGRQWDGQTGGACYYCR